MQNSNLGCKCLSVLIPVVLSIMCGCAKNRQAVIAVTGTNIGVEIAQNPANQIPQAKLGYQRTEIAIVPTNRSGDVKPDVTGGGASDVADVLMELKYSNIFSFSGAGIYQRLAVGETAVKQPGAAFMFARDKHGELKPEAADAISKALGSISERSLKVLEARSPLTYVYSKMQATKKAVFDKAAQSQGYKDFESFIWGDPRQPTPEQVNAIRQELEKDSEIKAELEKGK